MNMEQEELETDSPVAQLDVWVLNQDLNKELEFQEDAKGKSGLPTVEKSSH